MIFVAARGLVAENRGCCLVASCGLLVAVAALVQSTGSEPAGFSSCSSQALEHWLSSYSAEASLFRGMWNLLGPRIELISHAWADGFLSINPIQPQSLVTCLWSQLHICHGDYALASQGP